jgi:hypothetical protein
MFVFGFLPLACLPAIRGQGIGLVCAYLYVTYGLKGAAFALLILIPVSFFHSVILLIACNESLSFSCSMASVYILEQPKIGDTMAFKKYNLRYLILLLFSGLASLLDGVLSILLINLFGF